MASTIVVPDVFKQIPKPGMPNPNTLENVRAIESFYLLRPREAKNSNVATL